MIFKKTWDLLGAALYMTMALGYVVMCLLCFTESTEIFRKDYLGWFVIFSTITAGGPLWGVALCGQIYFFWVLAEPTIARLSGGRISTSRHSGLGMLFPFFMYTCTLGNVVAFPIVRVADFYFDVDLQWLAPYYWLSQ